MLVQEFLMKEIHMKFS